jgi:hypothetical protein
MEQDLFDWDEWSPLDTASFQFFPITLKPSAPSRQEIRSRWLREGGASAE